MAEKEPGLMDRIRAAGQKALEAVTGVRTDEYATATAASQAALRAEQQLEREREAEWRRANPAEAAAKDAAQAKLDAMRATHEAVGRSASTAGKTESPGKSSERSDPELIARAAATAPAQVAALRTCLAEAEALGNSGASCAVERSAVASRVR